ncbi:hypothetical protein CYLTODRAFT_419579 [Cylindrobasidium torrendii FP15055 ss-10]|uniref:F-box domain-containing protein n=1 Tax=Cylindrobasidium torrendii FP15055 ss-10 TaxID=1314674 RepID=A0A0D7BJF9_9AGAR|nr:hypothetical protein CYLTODRAFT_419579 [Cylindrobasidium torrendii FP15055 ss-10]
MDPPFVEDLLATNCPPTPAQAATIRNLLVPLRLQDEQSLPLQSVGECTGNEEHIRRLESILHPMRSIPDDVLREVFRWLIPSRKAHNGISILNPRHPLWTLGQVCRNWHEVTITESDFWTTVILSRKYGSHRLQTVLKRSRGRELRLYIYTFSHITMDLFAILLKEAPRWQHVTLKADEIYLAALTGTPFPSLRSASLTDTTARSRTRQTVPTKDLVLEAPLLKDPTLVWLHNRKEYNLGIPWAQLNTYAALDSCLHYVSGLTHAKTLVLHSSGSISPHESKEHCVLPNVKTLALRVGDVPMYREMYPEETTSMEYRIIQSTFQHFSFSNLETLIIESGLRDHFALPVFPTVTTLVLFYTNGIDEEHVPQIWTAFPALETLYVSLDVLDYEEHLSVLQMDESGLPALRALYLPAPTTYQACRPNFMDALEVFAAGRTRPLEKIGFFRYPQAYGSIRLEELVQAWQKAGRNGNGKVDFTLVELEYSNSLPP